MHRPSHTLCVSFRAEKSEVLSEDLQLVEKRVELVKHVYQTITKKLGAGLQTAGVDMEKRLVIMCTCYRYILSYLIIYGKSSMRIYNIVIMSE